MIIEGPVFCLEEFRSLSGIHAIFNEVAVRVRSEMNKRCLGQFIKSVWLKEKENSWSTRPELMRFCIECDPIKYDKIHIGHTEYVNEPSTLSKVVEREIPFFIEKLNAN